MIELKPLLLGAAMIAAAVLPAAGNVGAEPSHKDPKALLAAFADDVFVKKNLANVEAYVRTDYIQHNPLVAQGSKGFTEFFAAWFKASPDFKHEVRQIAVDGDRVWVHGTYSGTHAGDWLGIKATGKSYSFDAVDIFRVEDGKLAEHWDVLDIYGLFRQLGVVN